MTPIRLAIVGLGKIARDQHLPAIANAEGVELVAIASRNATVEGIPHFAGVNELLAEGPPIDAVALCTPPQPRFAQAIAALEAGKHVLLEKPPGATVGEIAPLVAAAEAAGRSLFTTWHSRFAPAVEPARAFLAQHPARSVVIEWKEDVRYWHPGQEWIWEPGGLGVFDPAINAFSILTAILPRPVFVTRAHLAFPSNRAAPVAAEIDFTDAAGLPVRAELDFLKTGEPCWDIRIDTDAGLLTLSAGGARMRLDGTTLVDAKEAEYAGIYRHFVGLIRSGRSDVDTAPLGLVADAFLLGRRRIADPFEY